ncbi:hypothetical protein GCM10011504_54880 [Siccirubricoccus deserti]|uniref:Uncharacterized protein n=1 Tax=Siccirubricoccus deserti TaxID=2013562 RepID=A0A9X0R3G1_9PROT|nr:hypothetical protein [Siccirubricoccus deserti]MBC4018950.1 hypothetical protein [Siccirubricoccus deserti]GGC70068.1 hypothetical protein GCM10011504_54880 [Siccirubricoccus deserti]
MMMLPAAEAFSEACRDEVTSAGSASDSSVARVVLQMLMEADAKELIGAR